MGSDRRAAAGAAPARERGELQDALRGLELWCRARQWRGSDPYDGLNATRLVGPIKHNALGRRALTQLVKRSPLDLRPLLGIPRAVSAAALAQLASGYALGAIPAQVGSTRLRETLQALLQLRCAGYEEPCWGYHFDVQTRVFFYPRGAPNTIASAFAGLALTDAYDTLSDRRLLDLATGVGAFFLRHVPQTQDGDGAFFGYLAGDRTPIHNANALVCALLARVALRTGREDMRSAAEAGLRWTLGHQRPDGSWPYGERAHLNWVDNFHTGYVLDSLMYSAEAGIQPDGGEALDRGLAYYRRALFLEDGTPKYMPNSIYPIDSQCVAQGIQTMALAGSRDPSHVSFAWTVFDFAQRRLRRADGSYLFQRRRHWVNATPHMRWVAAPMFHALSALQRAAETQP